MSISPTGSPPDSPREAAPVAAPADAKAAAAMKEHQEAFDPMASFMGDAGLHQRHTEKLDAAAAEGEETKPLVATPKLVTAAKTDAAAKGWFGTLRCPEKCAIL